MITIIKKSKENFKAVCPVCGCEFEYELEDINESDSDAGYYVICPECGRAVAHKVSNSLGESAPKIPPYNPMTVPDIIPGLEPTSVPTNCENCNWYRQMLLRKEPYLGDSPCQWCINSPTRPTCKCVIK